MRVRIGMIGGGAKTITGVCMRGWTMLAVVSVVPAAAQTPPKPIDPGSWTTANDYPPRAMRDGDEGLVVMTLSIDASGKVADCRVDVSSGADVLDRSSCALMRERAQFDPARDSRGRKVAGTVTKRIGWKLPRDRKALTLGSTTTEQVVTIGADDSLLSCTIRVGKTAGSGAKDCAEHGVDYGKRIDDVPVLRRQAGLKGPFLLTILVRTDHGASPSAALPPVRAGGVVMTESVHRFAVDAKGSPSDCIATVAGLNQPTMERAAQRSPCGMRLRFIPATDKDGNPIPTKAIVASRVTVRALSNRP